MQLSPDTVVVAAEHQVSCDVDNEAALLNLETGVYYGLDPVGAQLWKRLQSPITVAALVEAMMQDFAVTATTAESDLRTFLSALIDAGLVKIP